MKLSGIVATTCCLALLAACKKSENSTDNNNNNNNNNNNSNLSAKGQMLVAGKWQLTASTATMNYMGKDTTADLYNEMDECGKDDFVLFASDGTCTIDENANKCPGDNQVESADWTLLVNDTKLALADSNPDTFEVEISSMQFTLKITKPNSSGAPVTWIDTYKNIK